MNVYQIQMSSGIVIMFESLFVAFYIPMMEVGGSLEKMETKRM